MKCLRKQTGFNELHSVFYYLKLRKLKARAFLGSSPRTLRRKTVSQPLSLSWMRDNNRFLASAERKAKTSCPLE